MASDKDKSQQAEPVQRSGVQPEQPIVDSSRTDDSKVSKTFTPPCHATVMKTFSAPNLTFSFNALSVYTNVTNNPTRVASLEMCVLVSICETP